MENVNTNENNCTGKIGLFRVLNECIIFILILVLAGSASKRCLQYLCDCKLGPLSCGTRDFGRKVRNYKATDACVVFECDFVFCCG